MLITHGEYGKKNEKTCFLKRLFFFAFERISFCQNFKISKFVKGLFKGGVSKKVKLSNVGGIVSKINF